MGRARVPGNEPSVGHCGLTPPPFCLVVSALQVESVLFPELKGYNLMLGTVNPKETLVSDLVEETFKVFQKNQVGPLR